MPPATAGRSPARTREHLLGVLGPVVAATGCDLEDVVVTAAGRRSLIRVTVDADGGIDLDAVAVVSRAVSDVLDGAADDVLPGAYVLEVSSPGVDRPLAQPRHWRRNVGRLVKVDVDGHQVTGRIVGTSDQAVTLDVDGVEREVAWADLGPGKVQVEFSRAPADGEDDDAAQDAEDD